MTGGFGQEPRIDEPAVLLRLSAEVAALKEKAEHLERELIGNGQPGRIDRIEERLSKIEKSLTRAAGIIAGSVAVIQILVAFLFRK